MTKKISLFAVTAAAVALVLSGCGGGPGTGDMDMDDMPVMPSLDGTWVFTGFSAMITVPDVTVTVGDGMMPLSMDMNSPLAAVTQATVKGTLAMEGTAFKLTLAEGDDAISVKLVEGATLVNPGAEALAEGAIKGLIEMAQAEDVMITVDEEADPATMTVTGSFLDALLAAVGLQVPEEGLVGCKAPCMMAP